MIQDAELAELFSSLESDRVERKASPTDTNKIMQAICAFANDLPNSGLPGVLFIGQNDDGSCSNLKVTDQMMLNISQMRGDGRILPVPSIAVERKTIAKCNVIVVTVEPSDSPPVRLEGRAWIRVGPRRAIATLEEERRLTERQRWRNLTFDATPFRGAQDSDLDLEPVPKGVGHRGRSPGQGPARPSTPHCETGLLEQALTKVRKRVPALCYITRNTGSERANNIREITCSTASIARWRTSRSRALTFWKRSTITFPGILYPVSQNKWK